MMESNQIIDIKDYQFDNAIKLSTKIINKYCSLHILGEVEILNIIKKFKIKIKPYYLVNDDKVSYIRIINDKKILYINMIYSDDIIRYSMAYNLGEYLLDQNNSSNIKGYYYGYRKYNFKDEKYEMFASSLLMPELEFLEKYKELMNIEEDNIVIFNLANYFNVPYYKVEKYLKYLEKNYFSKQRCKTIDFKTKKYR